MNTKTTTKRSVCYLVSAEMLRLYPVEHWLTRFKEFTRRTPTDVVLPAVGFSGPLYDSAVHPYPPTFDRRNLLPDWIRAARQALGPDVSLWASVIAEGGFLDNEALWIRNQYVDTLSQLCIANPVSQEVLRDLLSEILDIGGIDGVVLDVTDVYPNSTTTGWKGITATCFCDHCYRAMKDAGLKETRDSFMGDGSLLRFVLNATETGTSHIDPSQDWIDQIDARSLVSLALARDFVQGERAQLEPDAIRLLKYFDARVRVTSEGMKGILGAAKEKGKRTALVLGSALADLTQMVTLGSLDRANVADEYWLPDAPDRDALPGNWVALQFLASRSTYYFNAFFEHVEGAQERVIHYGEDLFLKVLLRTSKQLMGNKLSVGSVYVGEKLPQYSGHVGIPLNTDDHLALVKRLSTEVTGAVLPPDVLDKFRISNPAKGI